MKTIMAVFLLMLALIQPALGAEASLDTVDVYIVPLQDFPEQAAAKIAQSMSDDMKLWVKATMRIGDLGIAKLPGTNQLIAEDIIERSQPVLGRLPEGSDKTHFLLLTTSDINSRAGGTRFQFSSHNREFRTSVVSLARMLDYVDGQPVLDNLALTRLYKMMKRAIGEMRLGWKRSTNLNDIMYSPIMSVDDLDRIGINHVESPPQDEDSDKSVRPRKSI